MTVTGIYPPTVKLDTPSFLAVGSAKLYFSLGSNTTDKKVRFVHLSLKNQQTGRSAFKVEQAALSDDDSIQDTQYTYPDILVYAFEQSDLTHSNSSTSEQLVKYDDSRGCYYIEITRDILNENNWNIGTSYIAQIRGDITSDKNPIDYCGFDGSEWYNYDSQSYSDYFNSNLNNFIEWSASVQLRPIGTPKIGLDIPDEIYAFDNTFKGNIVFEDDNNEKLNSYSFKVQAGTTVSDIVSVESGTVSTINQHDKNEVNCTLDLIELLGYSSATVYFNFTTNHGYEGSYNKTVSVKTIDPLAEDYYLKVSESLDDFGIINLTCKMPTGKFFIKRFSHLDDFSKGEILGYYTSTGAETVVQDCTAGSLIGYIYKAYKIEGVAISGPVSSDLIYPEFYGTIVTDQERSLKFSFDFQVSNDNQISRVTKIDTIGGQYPMFATNAAGSYHSFPISGVIAIEDNLDDDGEFLSYTNMEGLIPEQMKESYYGIKSYNGNPYKSKNTQRDFLLQRTFKDKVVEWLNNGKPKLLRNMTLGNYIVMFNDIQLTPKTQTGSMIWDFSCTAYEVEDGTSLQKLSKYKVISIPSLESGE